MDDPLPPTTCEAWKSGTERKERCFSSADSIPSSKPRPRRTQTSVMGHKLIWVLLSLMNRGLATGTPFSSAEPSSARGQTPAEGDVICSEWTHGEAYFERTGSHVYFRDE